MSFRAWLRAMLRRSPPVKPCSNISPLLVVIEGPHDIEFLRRISRILSFHNSALPDLAEMESRRELVFIPFGGGDLWLWVDRLAPLGLPEFHLYDREASPETELRQNVASVVNSRPGCRAIVTGKRSLESYLHPSAIHEVCGIELDFGDDEHVADLIAERLYDREGEIPWPELPRRAQVRRRNRVKKWLHTKAVDRMTVQRLAERDPQGEVVSWLRAISRMSNESA